jgi:hypothetical protein
MFHPLGKRLFRPFPFTNVVQIEQEFQVEHFPGGDRKLLFIHGYGGNLEQPGVKWFMERFREHGLDVTCIMLPTAVKDFREEVLEPARNVERRMGTHVAVGFSFGGLTLSYLYWAERRIFLSPFWGVNDRWMLKGTENLVRLLSIINKPLIPRRFDMDEAGPLAVEKDLEGIPQYVSFETLDQFFKAQSEIPPPMEGDVAFYSPQDQVVSLSAIEKRGIEIHRFTYVLSLQTEEGDHSEHPPEDRRGVRSDPFGYLMSACEDHPPCKGDHYQGGDDASTDDHQIHNYLVLGCKYGIRPCDQ